MDDEGAGSSGERKGKKRGLELNKKDCQLYDLLERKGITDSL